MIRVTGPSTETIVGMQFLPDEATWNRKGPSAHSGPRPYTDGRMVTCDDLHALRDLPDFEFLDFTYNYISDEGVALLDCMTHLRFLNLGSTNVTDNAISHLLRHRDLQELDVRDTGITEHGVHQLRTRLADCNIRY
jgi:hypothetical protein